MFCSKCGKELAENAGFCQSCGNKVEQPREMTAQERIKFLENEAISSGQKKDYDRAINICNGILESVPDNINAMQIKAKTYYNKGDYNQAIAECFKINSFIPNMPENERRTTFIRVAFVIGESFTELGQYDKAIECYEYALQSDSNNEPIKKNYEAIRHHVKGREHYEKQEYDQAIAEFEAVVKIKPSFYKALYNLGLCHSAKGNHEQAISYYAAALKINPSYSVVLTHKGYSCICSGNYSQAVADYEGFLKANPEDENAKQNLAIARQKLEEANQKRQQTANAATQAVKEPEKSGGFFKTLSKGIDAFCNNAMAAQKAKEADPEYQKKQLEESRKKDDAARRKAEYDMKRKAEYDEKERKKNTISSAVQEGNYVCVYNLNGSRILSKVGTLQGFTNSTFTINENGYVSTYDVKQKRIGVSRKVK